MKLETSISPPASLLSTVGRCSVIQMWWGITCPPGGHCGPMTFGGLPFGGKVPTDPGGPSQRSPSGTAFHLFFSVRDKVLKKTIFVLFFINVWLILCFLYSFSVLLHLECYILSYSDILLENIPFLWKVK